VTRYASYRVLTATSLSLCAALLVGGECSAQVVGGGLSVGNATPTNAGGSDPNASDTNSIDSSSFDRGRNISVRQEPRPDYQAEGVLVGGFMIYPKVSLGVAYDDNIFALHTGGIGDTIFSQAPEIDIQSTWARNSLSAYVKGQQDEYVSNPGEDAFQYGAGVAGKYEFGNSQLTGGVDFAHDVLPRAASNNVGLSTHRIPYDFTGLYGELASTFTRVRFSLRVDDQIYDYQNGQTAAGVIVDEQQYNHDALTVTGKAELAISPDAAVYLTAAGNTRNYEQQPPAVAFSLNNSGYDIDAGANFDITHLVRGEVQLGYLTQTYAAGSVFKPISGPSAKVQLQWFPTQLATITLIGNRAVGDAGVPGSAGFLLTDGSLQVDYELLRNVILTASGSIANEQYNGIDRTDQLAGAGISANWLLTRHIGLTFAYTYTNQTSSGAQAGPSFQDNRVMLSANLQY
jgi:hypothetical protein